MDKKNPVDQLKEDIDKWIASDQDMHESMQEWLIKHGWRKLERDWLDEPAILLGEFVYLSPIDHDKLFRGIRWSLGITFVVGIIIYWAIRHFS